MIFQFKEPIRFPGKNNEKWPGGEEARNPRCTQQIEKGYALKDEIDTEYSRTRKSGTFESQKETLIRKWDQEAGSWASDTEAVLLEIGGPTYKGRFRNAQISPSSLANTNSRWNAIRNFLQARLAALESLCMNLKP
jgi:hypothetical protein